MMISLCGLLFFSNSAYTQVTVDFESNCVTSDFIPISGIDGTGRNVFSDGSIELRYISFLGWWVVYIDGNQAFHTSDNSTPNPPNSASWIADGYSSCTSMNQLVINGLIEDCSNGEDDDGDFLIDCLDDDCGVYISGFENGQDASNVYGQDDFNSGAAGTSSTEFRNPTGIAQDPISGKVFITDKYNSRVLRFSSPQSLINGDPADGVLGQTDFTSSGGGISQNKFRFPDALVIDSEGRLYVTDRNNHRIMRFDDAANKANGANADGLLGQTTYTASASGHSQSRMNVIKEMIIDDSGSLWVSDENNSRVLRFDDPHLKANGANADAVLGNPNYTTEVTNCDASSLNSTQALEMINGNLYVGSNDRILIWNDARNKANGALADRVLGQTDFTTCNSTTSQSSTKEISGLYAKNDVLYVVDEVDHRILVFEDVSTKPNGANADYVLGQPDFLTSGNATTASSLNKPIGLTIMSVGNQDLLFVADYNNSRIVMFNTNFHTEDNTVLNGTMDGQDLSGTGDLNYAIVSPPTIGSVVIDNAITGEFTYNPGTSCTIAQDTVVSFTYSITNQVGCSQTAEVEINITNTPCTTEDCSNGIDDDLDSYVDCLDDECNGDPACPDSDLDMVNDAIDLDDDNDGILDADEDYVPPSLVNTSYQLTFENVTSGSATAVDLLELQSCNQIDLSVDYSFESTSGDMPMLLSANNDSTLRIDYNGISGSSILTYSFSESVDVVLSLDSNDPVEAVTFITPYDNIISGPGSTIESTSPNVSWHNFNNSEPTLFEFNGINTITLGLKGSNLAQFQKLSISNYTGNATCIDTDNDGIADYLDPDSDGDGCFDVTEAGFTDADQDGEVDGTGYVTEGTVNGSDGYTGTNTLVTDPSMVPIGCGEDNDSDGVTDSFDLDNDNDGIPNSIERACIVPDSILKWRNPGNQYFENGSPGTNEVQNLVIENGINATFSVDLSNIGAASQIQWNHNFYLGESFINPYANFTNKTESWSFDLDFDSDQPGLSFLVRDIDLQDAMGVIGFLNGVPVSPIIETYAPEMSIQVELDGSWTAYSSVDSNVPSTDLRSIVKVKFTSPINKLRIIRKSNPNLSDNPGYGAIEICDLTVCNSADIDSDLDGVFDHLDLDSDNDGIFDAIEAGIGVFDIDNDGIVDGDVGVNGLLNDLETALDSGAILYNLNDSDGDGIFDILELDSDGDGCQDVTEAGFPDSNNDGILGGLPISVTIMGKVNFTP